MLLAIPQSGSGTAHSGSIVFEDLFHVPLLSVESILALVLADLEHGAGRMDVVRIFEFGEQLGDVGEARRVDVVVLIYGEVVRRVAGVNDIDEGEGVVGLEFEDSDVGIRASGDVETVRIFGRLWGWNARKVETRDQWLLYNEKWTQEMFDLTHLDNAVWIVQWSGIGDLASLLIAESKVTSG